MYVSLRRVAPNLVGGAVKRVVSLLLSLSICRFLFSARPRSNACLHSLPHIPPFSRQWYERIRRPTMVLNALDDMVSVKDNIRTDLAEQHPGFVLLLTRFGSHVAFERDVTSFDSSYMFEVSIDFLETVRRLKHEEQQKTLEQQGQTKLAKHRPTITTP